jgi:hypothetical protein
VFGAAACEQSVRAGERDRAEDETERRREHTTALCRFLHQLETERRDEDAAAERHDRRDDRRCLREATTNKTGCE